MFIYIISYDATIFEIYVNGLHYSYICDAAGQNELLVKYLLKSYPQSQYNYVIYNNDPNQIVINLFIKNGLKQYDDLECRELKLEDLL